MSNEQSQPLPPSPPDNPIEVTPPAIAELKTLSQCDEYQMQRGWNGLPLSEFHHVTGEKNAFYRKLLAILKDMEANGEIQSWKKERNKRIIVERGLIGPLETLDDFWEFYQTHEFSGLTRKQMVRHEDAKYRSFYSLLKNKLQREFGSGWDDAMDAYFPKVRYRSLEIEELSSIEEFVAYFESHAELHGYTRTEIRNNVVRGSAYFYDRLVACIARLHPEDPTAQEDILSNFFESQQQRYPALDALATFEDVVAYAKDHKYFGMPRAAAWQNAVPGSKRVIKKISEMLSREYPDDQYEQEKRMNMVFPSTIFQEYQYFTSLDEFRSYIATHEELQQKRSVVQKNEIEGGRAFFDALQKFIQSSSPEDEWEATMAEFYPKDQKDWSEFARYASLQEFDDYLQANPALRKLSRSAFRTNMIEGSAAFYTAFYAFIQKEFPQTYVSILNEYFPTRFRKYDFSFDPEKPPVIFDSLRERAIGILLHDLGFLDSPTERKNVHVRTNLRRMHSLDFLASASAPPNSENTPARYFVEYHPLSPKEVLEGKSKHSIAMERLSHITVEKLKNIPLFFFSKLDELYLFLIHTRIRTLQNRESDLSVEVQQMLDQSTYLKNDIASSDVSEITHETACNQLLTVVTGYIILLHLQKLSLRSKVINSISESQAEMQLAEIKKLLATLDFIEAHVEIFAEHFLQYRSLISAAQRKAYQLDKLAENETQSSSVSREGLEPPTSKV